MALKQIGFSDVGKPKTTSGTFKSAGYPDLEFRDKYNRFHYLECKTFNINSVDTSFRSFYLSPSENFKITRDAIHFVFSYEIYKPLASGDLFKVRSWKLLTLENLLVNVKYEFNSDNNNLYIKENIVAEGEL